jgi:hypothetical protein
MLSPSRSAYAEHTASLWLLSPECQVFVTSQNSKAGELLSLSWEILVRDAFLKLKKSSVKLPANLKIAFKKLASGSKTPLSRSFLSPSFEAVIQGGFEMIISYFLGSLLIKCNDISLLMMFEELLCNILLHSFHNIQKIWLHCSRMISDLGVEFCTFDSFWV